MDAYTCTHWFKTLRDYLSNYFTDIGGNLEIDLAFCLDGSQVVTQDNFTHFLSFIKAITASLNVSENGTHVAVALYGNTPKLVIDFDDHYNQSSLESAVDAIIYPGSRLSNMGAGLSLVTTGLFNSNAARPNATRVLVVLTASKSQDDIEVPSYGLLAINKVNIFIIGVGIEYSLGQLREISSDPDSSFVVTYISGENLALATSSFKVTLAIGIHYLFYYYFCLKTIYLKTLAKNHVFQFSKATNQLI